MANKTKKDRRMEWDEKEENTCIVKAVSYSCGKNNEWTYSMTWDMTEKFREQGW